MASIKLKEYQDQIAALLLIIVSIVFTLISVQLPVKVTEPTTAFYDTIEAVPNGGVVLYEEATMIMNWFTNGQTSVSALKHIVQRIKDDGIKLVLYCSFDVSGFIGMQKMVGSGIFDDLTYGEDWVYLGYIPGWETVLAAMRENIRSVITVDYYGTSLDELPLMQNVNQLTDFSLLVMASNTSLDPWMRQWFEKGVPILMIHGIEATPMMEIFRKNKQIEGYCTPIKQTAEYESLTGIIGLGTKFSSVQSISMIYVILVVVAANIVHWREKEK